LFLRCYDIFVTVVHQVRIQDIGEKKWLIRVRTDQKAPLA